ncbi:MAG: uroporphyrinogen decarboxylase family protein [Victivallales bacterium]
MESKERVLRAIRHQEIDRVPSYFMSDGNITAKLAARLKLDSSQVGYLQSGHFDLNDRLGCDIALLWPNIIVPPGSKYFSCGSVHAALHDGTVIFEKMPLEDATSVDEILKYKWPSPDWSDYTIPSWMIPVLKDKAVCAYDMNVLLLYAMGIRGMENIMMDMASDPDMAHAVFKKISDHHCERIRRFLTVNERLIDIVGIGDDVAGQNGMFFSVDMWRKYVKPYLQKAVDLCLEFKVIPYFHGCGGFSVLYKDFIEMGITCTGRLQTEAKGNNFANIKKEFGKDLCLWGAIDGQHKVIEGTPDDVREHVRELLRNNFDGTGYVAGPTHSFTEDTPVDNILAVYEVLRGDF